MRSKILERIAVKTYRKTNYCVDAYAKSIINNKKQRFHYVFSWKSFNIGFGFCKTSGISGWKYMLSFDIMFLSCWIYFIENENTIKNNISEKVLCPNRCNNGMVKQYHDDRDLYENINCECCNGRGYVHKKDYKKIDSNI